MKLSKTVFPCLAIITILSCQKLAIEMPVQVINLDGSSEANYFEERIRKRLESRNFLIVRHDTPLKLYIENFAIHTYYTTETVYDDCGVGHTSYTLEEDILDGDVSLLEDGYLVDRWNIQASNYEVLKADDPILLQILFPDDDEDDCSDYWVKNKERMRANLRACARRIAAQATKKINRLN